MQYTGTILTSGTTTSPVISVYEIAVEIGDGPELLATTIEEIRPQISTARINFNALDLIVIAALILYSIKAFFYSPERGFCR